MPRRNAGFTYMALLFFVAVMGVFLATSGTIWSTAQRRLKERELLFVGQQFRYAIGSYYQHTPGNVKRYPPTLEALLLDDRMLFTMRHLRRVYADPLQSSSEWGLVQAADGGIMGVYSRAPGIPFQRANFSNEDQAFDNANHYAEWRFIYFPPAVPANSNAK